MNHHYPWSQLGLGVSTGHGSNRAFVETQDAMYIWPGVEFVEEQGFPGT